ncbi:putative nuclease HARBI1 [Cucumis melo var. makuwa]|uniref:Nuclease HARBI1 n=1 Tax=Cucumis melo var. makuwa TaxID=1194695 RepID=A0A5A7UFP3_CUCMM|nr:putative nuclease HARBI1 [Cucumis melo var. makuwa]TYJ96853.1 putative nuclease HARBI1 [Cucumis melo var. makuwa]
MFVALQEPKIQVAWLKQKKMSSDNYNIDSNDHYDERDVEYELDQLVKLGCGAVVHHFVMHVCKEPCWTSSHTGYKFVMEILNGHEDRCHQQFRMEKHIFQKFHDFSNRMVQERFQLSGATHDARIFVEALRRPHLGFPHPPKGKYYLADLGPYRGERYHLADFRRGSQPRGMKEVKIVVASMPLHNFIRVRSKTDSEFKPYDVPSNDEINYENVNEEHRGSVREMEMNEERDRIAQLLMSS